jgi:hypothetical protein
MMYAALFVIAAFPWIADGLKKLFPSNTWVKSLL